MVRGFARQRVFGQAGRPGLIEPLLERAALIRPAFVIVAGGDDRADAGEVRRISDGREHLRGADVAAAEHADFSVGVGKSGGPLDGVVAVVGLVDESVELAFGTVAAAGVFGDDDEAALCATDADAGFVAAIVRRAHEKDGEFAVGLGTVDVGFEDDAVTHRNFDAALEDDLRRVGGEGSRGGEQE